MTSSSASTMMGAFNTAETGGGMGHSKAEESSRRLVDLTRTMTRVEKHEQEFTSSTDDAKGDWTTSYKYWDGWEDVEELQAEVNVETSKLETLLQHENNPMGHCHSHTEERKMFELPEKEKMAFCERHRLLGNYLYGEGVLPKAAEQYKTALSYYDYCFPEENSEQLRLEEVRHAAQCNISLCYRQMGYSKEATEMASHAIRDSQDRRSHISPEAVGKAYYRRAQAYRLQDEYELAINDLREAEKRLGDNDQIGVKRELQAVQIQRRNYLESSKVMAKKMLPAKLSNVDNEQDSADWRQKSSLNQKGNKTYHSDSDNYKSAVANNSIALASSLSCLDLNIPLEPKCI